MTEISKIEKYFNQEIKEINLNNKKLSKDVAAFHYIDRILIVLSAAGGRVSIILLTTVIGTPLGIVSASFNLVSSLTTGIIKKLLSITRNKMKKHDKILVLAKSKLNIIDTLVCQASIDMEISHEEFITISNEKDKYEKMKEDIRTMNSSAEGKKIKQQDYKWK